MAEEKEKKPVVEVDEDIDIRNNQQALMTIENTMENFLIAADVSAVYNDPVEHGDTVIIPTAEVLSAFGFGMGYGEGTAENQEGSGGGAGGGRVLSRPVAVIIANPNGVRVEPVMDPTKVALAAITAAGMMFATLMRMRARVRMRKRS